MTNKVSVVIPNWSGRLLLAKNLPAVIAAKPEELIVVDDNSPDDSNNFLAQNYPQIKIIRHQKNLGFASACNSGVKAAKNEVVVLLNLDVVPEKKAFEAILPPFENENVFAVSFNEPQWSWAKIVWRNGFIDHTPGPKTDKTHISAWASGGSAAFRKSFWEKLGGFDEIYKPFYWEDIDLGYRAWKRGWKILWEPKAVVHHEHEAVIGKHFSKSYVDFVSQRNKLIFIWKNITDFDMVQSHKIHLLAFLIKHPKYFKVLGGALKMFPGILSARRREIKESRVSDKEIFEKFKQ